MKKWLYAIAVLIFAILSELSWSIENTAVRSPVNSTTVPQSSIRSGLIQNPNPVDTSGNLIITGNVTGGKHFRGLVPYGSTTNFQAQLGTSSLDSFLRNSADSTDFNRYRDRSRPYWPTEASTGRYRPFFSPTGTVATTRAGLAGTLTAATTRTGGRVGSLRGETSAGELALRAVPDKQTLSGLDASAFELKLRPMSKTPQELERLISNELSGTLPQLSTLEHLRSTSLPRNISRTEQYQDKIEQFQPELGLMDNKTAVLKEGLTTEAVESRDESLRYMHPGTLDTPRPEFGTKARFSPLDSRSTTEKKEDVTPTQNIGVSDYQSNRFPDSPISRSTDQRYRTEDYFSQSLRKQTYERRVSPLDELSDTDVSRKGPDVLQDVSARAKTILGEHKSYDSFSEDKFNLYINAAQAYLKQGRYYRAADSFTLASIYRPKDPFVYAGKSHALFAAGEYISSAMFLSRALQVMPEYAQRKVDLVDIMDGKDNLEARIADAEERLQISDAPELHFLLGYIYFRMNKLDAAKKAIDVAYKKLPNSKAIGALKKAIDSALASSQPAIQ